MLKIYTKVSIYTLVLFVKRENVEGIGYRDRGDGEIIRSNPDAYHI